MEDLQLLKRRLEREKQARKQAESILEEKALQLHEVNIKLKKLNEELELKIAERTKQLRISEEKYRGLIENMELGLLEVDNDQFIIRAYDWFCDMTGYTQEELIGRNAKEVFFLDGQQPEILKLEQQNRARGQAGTYEMQIRHKNGYPIWVLISGCPVMDKDGKVIGSLGIHYDITVQKTLQKDLEEAKRTAEKAQQAEEQFLAKMSHEIRTPLNAIIGMSHLLNDTNSSPDQQEYLEILRNSADILKLLISDILDFSKIQAGEIKVQEKEFNLSALVIALQKTLQIKVSQKNINVITEIDPNLRFLIIGDELLLNQILINLLNNAMKFTKEGAIGIRIEKIQETTADIDLKFQVFDTGIGISADKQDLIFQDFKQANEDTNHYYGGTGLGLSITRQLVELQGGKIHVSSVLDKGTTFSFQLKYKKGNPILEKKIKESIVSSPGSFQQEHILVVEDNYMNRKYIFSLLKKWNLNFDQAVDGIEAIEATQKKKYDLIFMDISMPRMNGYDAADAIRNKTNLNQATPIIALSASALVTQKEQALNIGMTDFLCKPFEPGDLIDMLNKYLTGTDRSIYTQQLADGPSFLPPLNAQHIHTLYNGDWEYAQEMFQIFLEHTVPAFRQIESILRPETYASVKKMIHKLKPNFTMVGLLDLNQLLNELEVMILEEKEESLIRNLHQQIEEELNNALPIIQQTTDTLTSIKSTV